MIMNSERFFMKYIIFACIVCVAFQSSPPLLAIDVSDVNPGGELVPIEQCVERVFKYMNEAKDEALQFLNQPHARVFGCAKIAQFCQEITPITRLIKEAAERLYSPDQSLSIKDSEDRQGMRTGGSCFETIFKRLDMLNERLKQLRELQDDDDPVMHRKNILIVSQVRLNLLHVQNDLTKFFKILSGQPCDIGEAESPDWLFFVQHFAKKLDLHAVPDLVMWLNVLCKWYNELFVKEGQQPIELPESLVVVIPSQALAHQQHEVSHRQVPHPTQPREVVQSRMLEKIKVIEEFWCDLNIGFGGTKRQLHAWKNYVDGRGGLVSGLWSHAEQSVDNAFVPSEGSGIIKRFAMYVIGGVAKRIDRCRRWLAVKCFFNKNECDRKPWQETRAGQFWSGFLRGWPGYQHPQPPAVQPRKWWQRLMFWRR